MTTIRDASFPKDQPAVLSFIDGSQTYEFAIQADRHLNNRVAAERVLRLTNDISDNQGRTFVAEYDGAARFRPCVLEMRKIY